MLASVFRLSTASYTAETEIVMIPGNYQHFAGLIAWYGRNKFHHLAVTADEDGARVLTIYSCAADWPGARISYPITPVRLPGDGVVQLGCDVDGSELRFRYALEGEWTDLGVVLDQSAISDEAGNGPGNNFTGAFVGMCAHDTSGRGRPADFLSFTYEARNG